MTKKLDEKEKSEKNLQQQIKHTQERINDADYAIEAGDLSGERKRELEIKNEHRREDIVKKQDELEDE